MKNKLQEITANFFVKYFI